MKLHDDIYKPEEIETNGRDEMNVIEFPLTTLRYEPLGKDIKSREFYDERTDKDGKRIKMEWSISSNEKYGHPGFSAQKVFLALMQITKEQNNFTQRKVFCPLSHILKTLGLPDTKQYRKMVIRDMSCLGGIWVSCKESFWDNKWKHYSDMGFGILQGFNFPKDKHGRRTYGPFTELDGMYLWNQVYFEESFLKNNIKSLDIKFALSLKYPISLSLYRLLDKRKYFHSVIEFPLKILAFEKLGMSRTYNTAQIKRYLDRANQELEDRGFIKGWTYKDKNGEVWIVYYLSEQKSLEQPDTQKTPSEATEEPNTEELNPLAQELIKRHVSQIIAIKLVEQYPQADIQLQIEHHDYLLSIGKKILSAGWFVRAIPENWMPPEDFKSSLQLKKEQIARAKREKIEIKQQKLEAERQAKQQAEQMRLNLEKRKAFYNNPNQAEYNTLWEQAKAILEKEIDHQPFLTWIEPNFIAKIDGNTIYIDTPNTFIMNWLIKNYTLNLKNTFTDLINEEAYIRFLVNNPQTPQMPNCEPTTQPTQKVEKKTEKTAKRERIKIRQ